MLYVKVNGNLYPATIMKKDRDRDWNFKQVVEIFLTMTPEVAENIFVDDISWSIVEGETIDGNFEIYSEIDYSDYSIAGPITDYRDGKVSVKMGKLTDRELLEIITGNINL